MEKIMVGKKNFYDEMLQEYSLNYWISVCFGENGRIYGIGIEKSDANGLCEEEWLYGFSENREETENFACRLWGAMAMPVEMAALCDDYISEREAGEVFHPELAAS